MKFDEKVLTALEVLTDAAENDFELFRICTLVRDLIAPPVAEQVDNTHQRFNGITYGLQEKGHYAIKVSIHRAIATYYYGDIPPDFDVHHDNRNKADNSVTNLIVMTKSEHQSLHMPEKLGKLHAARKARSLTCEYCGKPFKSLTPQAKFCSEHCENAARWERTKSCIPKKCEWCGKDFMVAKYSDTRFCSNSCAAHWREQQKPKKPDKICEWCGKSFHAIQNDARFCSKHCSSLARFPKTETRVCPVCGESFKAAPNHRQTYCSVKCVSKAARKRRKLKKTGNKGGSVTEINF